MSRDELVERFTLERVSPSPAQFDYAKLDWMNGVYLRGLSPDEFAHHLVLWLGEQGYAWDAEVVRKAAPLVQEKIARLGEFPDYARFRMHDQEGNGSLAGPVTGSGISSTAWIARLCSSSTTSRRFGSSAGSISSSRGSTSSRRRRSPRRGPRCRRAK